MPLEHDVFKFLSKHLIEYKTCLKTADFVSLKIGGESDIIIFPKTIDEFCVILNWVSQHKYKYFILNKGTNTYFKDSFYNGIIICTNNLNDVEINGNFLISECGTSLFKCCEIAREHELSGLEFAYGIPGGIGGALFMNASAYEKSISQIVFQSVAYDMDSRKVVKISFADHKFGEKNSVFQEKNLILLKTFMCLKNENASNINEIMEKNLALRLLKQPCDFPNAGSIFKRPKNNYASRLIDKCGLKGFEIGGAAVSKKHAGFIVNNCNATASDVNMLINYIKKQVKSKFDIDLEKEVIYVE